MSQVPRCNRRAVPSTSTLCSCFPFFPAAQLVRGDRCLRGDSRFQRAASPDSLPQASGFYIDVMKNSRENKGTAPERGWATKVTASKLPSKWFCTFWSTQSNFENLEMQALSGKLHDGLPLRRNWRPCVPSGVDAFFLIDEATRQPLLKRRHRSIGVARCITWPG